MKSYQLEVDLFPMMNLVTTAETVGRVAKVLKLSCKVVIPQTTYNELINIKTRSCTCDMEII
jgi:hypothetical protein